MKCFVHSELGRADEFAGSVALQEVCSVVYLKNWDPDVTHRDRALIC